MTKDQLKSIEKTISKKGGVSKSLNIPELTFTQDWFTENIPLWKRVLEPYVDKPCIFLELGVFEGMSTRWLLNNILTDEESEIHCVDTFNGSRESGDYNIDMLQVKENFKHNIHNSKVSMYPYDTTIFLSESIIREKKEVYDVIYIDASHQAKDCMLDMLLSWKLLKQNGLLIVDDYDWKAYPEAKYTPTVACDTFLIMFEGEYELIEKVHQLIVRKL